MQSAPPVAKVRHISLDVMRGVAILGILLANIASFASPEAAHMMAAQTGEVRESAWQAGLLTAFVSGKFRGMLAMLFGIGLWMQYERRSQKGEAWPGTYFKRTVLLFVIGCLHGVFIWYGDILATYAVIACLAMMFVKMEDKTILIIGSVLIGLGIIMGIGTAGMVWAASSADASAETMDLSKLSFLKIWFDPAREIEIYQSGPYGMQLVHRIGMFTVSMLSLMLLIPNLLGQFLIGIWLAREGVLAKPAEHKPLLGKLAIIGLGIGLPLNMLAIPIAGQGRDEAFSMVIELGVGGILSLGYFAILGWLCIVMPKLLTPLAAVGKCALSCYILTSLIATTVFYSYGGALFGRVTFEQTAMIVGAIWVALILFAMVWTRFFSFGPLEWAWRSAVEKRKLPMRKSLPEAAAP